MHDQLVSFLQTAIVLLLLTNMISAFMAFYAMKTANMPAQPVQRKLERKLQDILRRS